MAKSAADRPNDVEPTSFLGFLVFRPLRRVAPLVVVATVVGGGGYWAWTRQAERIAVEPHYRIGLEAINVTPPPPWIVADVKAEALRDASLDPPLDALDPQLAERTARAFAFHPWIAHVVRVQVATGAMSVEVAYRRPVCMVELPPLEGRRGLYAVDAEGTLLPSRDFLDDPKKAARYPRLGGFTPADPGRVGTRWPDPRIVGGARTAAALTEVWDRLMLAKITPLDSGEQEAPPQFELVTRGGSRIVWGRAPGGETSPEISAAKKTEALLRYLAEHGGLEGRDGPQRLDVRGEELVVVASLLSPDGNASAKKPKPDEERK